MAFPRDHYNGLTTHFLLTLILNWITCYISTIHQWRCHHYKTPQHQCYFVKNNKKGGRTSVKKSNFRRFCHKQFLDAVQWKRTHQCRNLEISTLVITLHSQWHCHRQRMPLDASWKLSSSVRGPGPSTNVWSVSEAQKSTVGLLTAINSQLECWWDGKYDNLTRTYFKLQNSLTTTIYKLPPGYGTLFFTKAFTKRYEEMYWACHDIRLYVWSKALNHIRYKEIHKIVQMYD